MSHFWEVLVFGYKERTHVRSWIRQVGGGREGPNGVQALCSLLPRDTTFELTMYPVSNCHLQGGFIGPFVEEL